MAYITVSTDSGEFIEFHTSAASDKAVQAFLLDRAVERLIDMDEETPTVEELSEMFESDIWN